MRENFDDINNDLLVKYLLGETNKDENRIVEKWISSDSSNQQYFNQFKLIWDESKTLAIGSKVDEDMAWLRFRNRIKPTTRTNGVVRKMNVKFPWMRIAALFIVLVGSAILFYLMHDTTKVNNLVVQTRAEVLKDTLPDGSIVTLNKNSLITYPDKFKDGTRKIILNGEAFFDVSPDKNKPFVIQVNDVQVRVVGTSFNVRQFNGNTEVIVETGVVQVIRKKKLVELKPREKLIVHQEDSIMVKQDVTDKFYDYYRSKQFVCDNTPLWKLVEVLNEAYDTNIVIEKKSLKSLQINTTFDNQSLDHILEIISETFKLTVSRRDNKIILE